MRPPWPHRTPEPPPPVYVGSHEDKLTRIRPLHIDPDDDGHTREDRIRERDYKQARSTFFGARRG